MVELGVLHMYAISIPQRIPVARQQNHESNLRATQLPHDRRKPSPHTPPSPLKWLHLSHTPQNGAVDALAGIPQGIARQPKFFRSSVWQMVFGLAISLPWRSSVCRSTHFLYIVKGSIHYHFMVHFSVEKCYDQPSFTHHRFPTCFQPFMPHTIHHECLYVHR